MQDFVQSQARGIGREKHRAMLRIRRVRDHVLDLFAAQNRGQRLPLPRRRDRERRAVALQRRVIEEPQPVRHDIAGTPGPLTISQQMDEIGLHLVVRDLIGRPPIEPGESRHRPQIRFARAVGEPTRHHVVLHPSAQLGHDTPPYPRRAEHHALSHVDRSDCVCLERLMKGTRE